MERSRRIVRVSLVGIAVNVVLVAFKALVGFLSGSIAIILDAVNNLSDALSSVITIIGAKLATRPPDREHPFGHGRIEYISSVTIAVIVLLAGVTSFRESIEKILHPEAANYTAVTLAIIAAAVLAKVLLGRYVKKAGKKVNSASLTASGSDAIFDAAISLTTLVAAGISMIWGLSVEGYLGLIISAVIFKAGIEILIESLNEIIGLRVDSGLAEKLKERVTRFDGVHGAYDLILHRYGPEKTIGSVHIEVDDGLTARELHKLTKEIATAVFTEFGIVLTIGVYASNNGNESYAQIRKKVEEIALSYPEVLELHGFYIEPEEERLSFDLIVAFESDAAKIREEIGEKIKALYPQYSVDILLDSDFSD